MVSDSMGPSTYESVGASEVNSRSKLAVSLAHGLATASSAVLEAGEHYDRCRVIVAGSIRAAEVPDTEHHSGTRKARDR